MLGKQFIRPIIVLIAAQTTAFFENATQMVIPHATVVRMEEEGIEQVEDLVEFTETQLEHLAENLRKPSGRIEDPNNSGTYINTPGFQLGA